MKKALALLLTLACVLALAGCTVRSTTQLVEKSVTTLQEITDAALDPETDAPESGDTFVTADLSYHQFLDAKPKGINVIDAGHFPTEDVVCPVILSELRKRFPALYLEKSASHREVIQYYVEGE